MAVKLSAVSQNALVVPFSRNKLSVFDINGLNVGDVLLFERRSLSPTQLAIVNAQKLAGRHGKLERAHAHFTHVAIYAGNRQIIDIMPNQHVRLVELCDVMTNATRFAVLQRTGHKIDRGELLAAAEAKRGKVRYSSWPKIASDTLASLTSRHLSQRHDHATCVGFAVALLAEVEERRTPIDPSSPAKGFGDLAGDMRFFPASLLTDSYIRKSGASCTFVAGRTLAPDPPRRGQR